jgi:thiol-disulfide isomerase/thioredoxin
MNALSSVLLALMLAVKFRAAAQPAASAKRAGDLRIATVLKVGDIAPDFTLNTKEGNHEVKLSSFRGQRPVVLVFGSYTCPPFREHVGALESLYDKHKDQVEFFMIYIKEAHPKDGWVMPKNEQLGIRVDDPKTLEERVAMANTACSKLEIKWPCLVDDMKNTANLAYSAWPDRIYIIGADGRIALLGDQGPRGFAPGVEHATRWLERFGGRNGVAQ